MLQKLLPQTADPGARIIFGAYYDRMMKPGELKVTIVAAGFNGSQPGALFGTNGFEGRQGMFGRSTMEGSANASASGLSFGNNASLLAKKASTPIREQGTSAKDPVIHARGEESADEMMAQKSLNSGMGLGMDKKPSSSGEQAKPVAKEKENDAWDIPAFLRRRKK